MLFRRQCFSACFIFTLFFSSGFVYSQSPLVVSAPNIRAGKHTALDKYVAKKDDTYNWKVVKRIRQGKLTAYVVDMKSQTWRTKKDVNRPVWQHWVHIIKPDKPVSETALLIISGGANDGKVPNGPSGSLVKFAKMTNCVVVELKMVPNQKLIFNNDGEGRKEDDLIGYTWDQYIKTGDPTWAARFPMVKSAVRAMDTVQALVKRVSHQEQAINHFVVAGASKRGWTTWLTGAVDSRVSAIAPIVIDVLNVDPSMKHHYAAYGFWAPAVGNYLQHRIFQRMDHPRIKELYDLVDPYSYLDRLKMPKMILNGSGDQFFLPDSSQFYFDDLMGEKHIRYVPNRDHSLNKSDAPDTLAVFFQMIATDKPRPEFSWTFENDGSIRVDAKTEPKEVRLWQAFNTETRDFRLEMKEKFNNGYTSTILKKESDGSYIGRAKKPKKGFTAYFVELTFEPSPGVPFKLTTAVRVEPDVLPFKDKDPKLDNKLGPGKG